MSERLLVIQAFPLHQRPLGPLDQPPGIQRGMTSVPGPLVQVATQINLLAAQSTVVEGQLDPRWSG
jgi:hypothetical protein